MKYFLFQNNLFLKFFEVQSKPKPGAVCSVFVVSVLHNSKERMQAMTVEKDNACDRVDVCEEQSKAARTQVTKAGGEVDELMTKARQLETGLDLTTERLGIATLHLEGKEKQLATCEGYLEEAEEHADIAEDKIIELEEELRVVAHNLKSLEVAEEKANRRDETCDKLQKDSESWEEEATKSEEDLVFVGDTMMQLEKAKKGVFFKSLESIFSFQENI